MHSRFDRTAYTCIVVERGTPGASTCIEHVLRHRDSAEVGFGFVVPDSWLLHNNVVGCRSDGVQQPAGQGDADGGCHIRLDTVHHEDFSDLNNPEQLCHRLPNILPDTLWLE